MPSAYVYYNNSVVSQVSPVPGEGLACEIRVAAATVKKIVTAAKTKNKQF